MPMDQDPSFNMNKLLFKFNKNKFVKVSVILKMKLNNKSIRII